MSGDPYIKENERLEAEIARLRAIVTANGQEIDRLKAIATDNGSQVASLRAALREIIWMPGCATEIARKALGGK